MRPLLQILFAVLCVLAAPAPALADDADALYRQGLALKQQGKNDEALKIFELNAKRHPGVWPTDVGLARAYAAAGKTKEALKHARLALAKAPDEGNRKNLEQIIQKLEKGEKIN